MQRDAVDRLGLTRLLLEPELLGAVEPDVHLVGTLLSLNKVMPETTKATARQVVAQVVEQIERRIADATRSAVTGALDRASRTHRPRPGRHRLGRDDPREPAALPAGVPHGRPAAARRARPPPARRRA